MKIILAIAFTLMTALPIASADPAAELWVWVDRAVDGDTIRLRDGGLVRYLGIDAPEIDHHARKAEPFAYAAFALNRRLVDGKRVRLRIGHRKTDRYGRLLAHPIDHNGRMINLLILQQGLAYYYPATEGKNRSLESKMLNAQRIAMQKGVGIWSQPICGQGPFIGNRRSKRFHTTDCPYGKKTGRKNQTPLSSGHDAHWQGYAPCNRCLASAIKKGLQHR